MSENSIERLEEREPAEPEAPAEPERGLAPRAAGRGLAAAGLVLALAAAGAAGWLYGQQQALRQELQVQLSQHAELSSWLGRAEAALRDAREGEDKARNALTARLEQVEQGREALAGSVAALDAKLQRRPETWRAAEAEYLLRLAALRLTERDTASAVRLLADADARVRELAAATGLRTAIAQDLAALRTAPRVDLAGLSLRIEGLLPRIPALPAARAAEPPASAEERVAEELKSEWEKSLDRVWAALRRDWIEVKHYQGASPELELPEIRHYLDQNLALALQQAQWAAARGDAGLYAGSLGRAEAWARQYFDPAAGETRGFLEALAELKAQDVAPALPTVDASLAAAQGLAAQLEAEPVPIPASESGAVPAAETTP